MKTLIRDEYRASLKASHVVEEFPTRNFAGASPGAVFVGAATCAKCHSSTYQKWSTTQARPGVCRRADAGPKTQHGIRRRMRHLPHGPASRTRRAGDPRPRPRTSGATSAKTAMAPGSQHVAEPDNATSRQPMKLTIDQSRNTLCVACHDHDNSVDFEFTKYWSQIAHQGLDDYKDPKVHVGLASEASDRTPKASDP